MKRPSRLRRIVVSSTIVAVAATCVVLAARSFGYANTYPGPFGAADDANHWGCWAPGGTTIPQSLFDTWWTNVPALTNVGVGFDNPCQGYTDARYDIRQHPSFPNALGTSTCVDTLSNGRCDTFDVWVDPDRDAQGYCAQFNTWCHEVGHSLGLDHYGSVVAGTCMGAGADACVDPPRTWRLDDHEIGHVNTL